MHTTLTRKLSRALSFGTILLAMFSSATLPTKTSVAQELTPVVTADTSNIEIHYYPSDLIEDLTIQELLGSSNSILKQIPSGITTSGEYSFTLPRLLDYMEIGFIYDGAVHGKEIWEQVRDLYIFAAENSTDGQVREDASNTAARIQRAIDGRYSWDDNNFRLSTIQSDDFSSNYTITQLVDEVSNLEIFPGQIHSYVTATLELNIESFVFPMKVETQAVVDAIVRAANRPTAEFGSDAIQVIAFGLRSAYQYIIDHPLDSEDVFDNNAREQAATSIANINNALRTISNPPNKLRFTVAQQPVLNEEPTSSAHPDANQARVKIEIPSYWRAIVSAYNTLEVFISAKTATAPSNDIEWIKMQTISLKEYAYHQDANISDDYMKYLQTVGTSSYYEVKTDHILKDTNLFQDGTHQIRVKISTVKGDTFAWSDQNIILGRYGDPGTGTGDGVNYGSVSIDARPNPAKSGDTVAFTVNYMGNSIALTDPTGVLIGSVANDFRYRVFLSSSTRTSDYIEICGWKKIVPYHSISDCQRTLAPGSPTGSRPVLVEVQFCEEFNTEMCDYTASDSGENDRKGWEIATKQTQYLQVTSTGSAEETPGETEERGGGSAPTCSPTRPGSCTASQFFGKLFGMDVFGDARSDNNIYTFFVTLFSALALIGILVGGIQYISAAGDPANAEKGKKTIIYTLTGVIAFILSAAIVNLVIRYINELNKVA